MKKIIFVLVALVFSHSSFADWISGDMQLRDAIYLYGKDVDGRGNKILASVDCDVLQVVFDLDTGYTNLLYGESDSLDWTSVITPYPDTIESQHKMFAFALYKNKKYKFFRFMDFNDIYSAKVNGNGTFFAYCYSTKPGAYVYYGEGDKCQVTYSDGEIVKDSGLCN